ncbi:M48 family metallopeptidase [Streptomyces sp. NPDC003720]|uniref:M48 family metallopeptidase n=1 Tax=Streptomyces sp. NPDC003720 TaxID=3364684 RepID=UPI0036A93909
MAASPETASGDTRPVGDGTTVRFAVLVILIMATSGLMLMYVAIWWVSHADSSGCGLAAGLDPSHPSDLQAAVSQINQGMAYANCQRRFAQPPPWWVPVSWLALLAAAAVALFGWLPVWKARRSRVVPLAAVDGDGEIRRVLEEAASVAGVARMPRVVVDPAAASVGALVFGRTGKPVLSLHGGLLARRVRDPEGFRAVLLHEFAHIRNGDITLTYATVALWRVFLVLVAPPYLAGLAVILFDGLRSGSRLLAAPSRSVLLMAFLTALVYLARSDVLRSREFHADRAAARWGADPRGWHGTAPAKRGGVLTRELATFAGLWRPHPRWDLRHDALTDAGPVYGVFALPMFLTGAGAVLINTQLLAAPMPYVQYTVGQLVGQAAALVAAGTVAGVVGTALWRAVIHAVLTGRRPPSGIRAGLWLGAGMTVGNLISGQGTIAQFFPSRSTLLLQFLLGGPAFTWWTAQCAQLWVRTWRGRTLRPALVVSLVAGGLALAQWFTWWHGYGVRLATGWWYDPAGFRQWLEQVYPGPAADHRTMLSAIALVSPFMLNLAQGVPLVGLALAALWVVPLAAWALRPLPGVPPWTRGAARDIEGAAEPPAEALPGMRRVMLPSLLCGVGCWAVVVAVLLIPQAGVFGADPRRAGIPGLLFLAWTFVALTAAALTAAVVAAVRADRYRLLVTLAAAQTTVLVGLAAPVALLSFDGCFDRLSLFESSCGWRPARLAGWTDSHTVLDFAVMTVTVAAFVVAAAVSAVRRAPGSRRRPATPAPQGREGPRVRRVLPAALCVLALTVSAARAAHQEEVVAVNSDVRHWQEFTLRDWQEQARKVQPRIRTGPVSPRIRAMQVNAWSRLGGEELLHRVRRERDGIAAIGRVFVAGKKPPAYLNRIRPHCERIGLTAVDAASYFDVPDPQAQKLWQRFMLNAAYSTMNCRKALAHLNANRSKEAHDALGTSFREIRAACLLSEAIDSRIEAVERAGGM